MPRLIRICRIQWWCTIFLFRTGIHFSWANLVQKNENCQFVLKFSTWINSNMQNSMVMFNFFIFDWNYPFGGNLVQKKNQICLFKLNFGTQTNSNMQNSMMRFILSATDFKYHFTVNLVQKILCLNWIWYLDYFEYAELNGMVHLICFRLEIPFLGKFGSKNQNS